MFALNSSLAKSAASAASIVGINLEYDASKQRIMVQIVSDDGRAVKLSAVHREQADASIIDYFPILEGILDGKIQRDCTLHIHKCNKIRLNLNADKVYFSETLALQRLTVKCRDLYNFAKVKAAESISLSVVEKLHNNGAIESGGNINIDTSPFSHSDRETVTTIANKGKINAAKVLEIKSSTYKKEQQGDCILKNQAGGEIYAGKKLRCYIGHAYNDGSIESSIIYMRLGLRSQTPSHRNIKINQLINNGRIVGESTQIESRNVIINDTQGILIGQRKLAVILTASGHRLLVNAGEIQAKDIRLSSIGSYKYNEEKHTGLFNLYTGKIRYDATCELLTSRFYNAGEIVPTSKKFKTRCKIRFRSNVNALNTQTGLIFASELDMSSTGSDSVKSKVSSLYNFGGIYGKDCHLHVSADLRNQHQAICQGQLKTLVSALGSVFNSAEITSYGLTSIHALASLINAENGFIYGKQVQLRSNQITVEKNASVSAASYLTVAGDILSNDGSIDSGGNLHGNFSEVINRNQGILQAKQELTIIANYIKNEGVIKSTLLLLQAVVRLSDSVEAVTHARELLTLLARRTIDLSGKVGSLAKQKSRSILIECFDLVTRESATILSQSTLDWTVFNSINTSAEVCTNGDVNISHVHRLVQQASGLLSAENIHIDTIRLSNDGKVIAKNGLFINCQNKFEQSLQGLIEIGLLLSLKCDSANNAGTISSQGTLTIQIRTYLNNQKSGKITSFDDMNILIGDILDNAGEFFSDRSLVMKAKNAINNTLGASMVAKRYFQLETGASLRNAGRISSENQLHIYANSIIENAIDGCISAKHALHCIANYCLKNSGVIQSENDLVCDANKILKNHARGSISAHYAIKLIAARLVVNAGLIQSYYDGVHAKTEELFENIDGGQLKASGAIEIIARDIVNRDADLEADVAIMRAARFLTNDKNSQIIGKSFVELTSVEFTNKGLVDAVAVNVNCDLLNNNGQLVADQQLDIRAKTLLTNYRDGKIESKDVLQVFCAHGLNNFGSLLSGRQCSLIAERLHHASDDVARIQVGIEGELFIQAIDLILAGQVQAGADMLVMVENDFTFSSLTLKANGLLHIKMKNGLVIEQPISTPGGLVLEVIGPDDQPIDIKAQLNVGKECHLLTSGNVSLNTSGRFLVHRIGGNFSVSGANVQQYQTGVVAQGSAAYAAHKGSVQRHQGFTLSVKGTFIEAKLDSQATNFVERSHGDHVEHAGRNIHKTSVNSTAEQDAEFVAGQNIHVGHAASVIAKNINAEAKDKFTVGIGDNNSPDSNYAAFQDPYQTGNYMPLEQLAQRQMGTLWHTIGALYAAEVMNCAANRADITGQVISDSDMQWRANVLQIIRRQHRYQQLVVDVIKKKKWIFIHSKKVIHKLIDVAVSQSEAKVMSQNGKLVARVNHLFSRAGLVSGAKEATILASANINTLPNIDAGVKSSHARRMNFFSGTSAYTHRARHRINPTCLLSPDGTLDCESGHTLAGQSTFFYGKSGIRLHAAYIKLLTTKIKEQHFIDLSRKRAMLTRTTGTYEFARPVILLSPAGKITIRATADLLAESPQMNARDDIDIDASGRLMITATKLLQTKHSVTSGLNGLSYVCIDKNSQQQTVIRPILISDSGDIKIQSRESDVFVEAADLQAQNGDIVGISHRGVFILTDTVLEHHESTKITQVGITGLAARSLTSMIKRDATSAAKAIADALLPPIEAIRILCQAKDGQDLLADGSKALMSILDLMKGLADSEGFKTFFTESLKQKMSTVGIQVSQTRAHQRWQTVQQAWMLARRIVIFANEIKLQGIQASADEMMLKAQTDVRISGSSLHHQTEQSSQQVGVMADVRDKNKFEQSFSIRVQLSELKQQVSQFINSLIKVNTLSVTAGGEIDLTDVVAETKRAYLDARILKMKSRQSSTQLYHDGVQVGFDQQGVNHFSVDSQRASKHWVDQQTGVHASEVLHASITEQTDLVGAAITLGDQAKPINVDGTPMYRYVMPHDGDDIFHAFGLSRVDCIVQLLQRLNEPHIAQKLAHECACLFVSGKLPLSSQFDELRHLVKQYQLTLQQLHQSNTQPIQKNYANYEKQQWQCIVKTCAQTKLLEIFITDYLADADYVPSLYTMDDLTTGSIDVIALLAKHNIEIWQQNDEQVMICLHRFMHDSKLPTKRVEFTQSGTINVLFDQAGLLITPTLTYADLDDKDYQLTSHIGFDRGARTVVEADITTQRQERKSRATVSDNIVVRTQSVINGLNRQLSKAQEVVYDDDAHYRIYVPFIKPGEIAETMERFRQRYLQANKTPPPSSSQSAPQTQAQLSMIMKWVELLRKDGKSDEEIAQIINSYETTRFLLQLNRQIVEDYYQGDVPVDDLEKIAAGLMPKIIDGKLFYDVPQTMFVHFNQGRLEIYIDVGSNPVFDEVDHELTACASSQEIDKDKNELEQMQKSHRALMDDLLLLRKDIAEMMDYNQFDAQKNVVIKGNGYSLPSFTESNISHSAEQPAYEIALMKMADLTLDASVDALAGILPSLNPSVSVRFAVELNLRLFEYDMRHKFPKIYAHTPEWIFTNPTHAITPKTLSGSAKLLNLAGYYQHFQDSYHLAETAGLDKETSHLMAGYCVVSGFLVNKFYENLWQNVPAAEKPFLPYSEPSSLTLKFSQGLGRSMLASCGVFAATNAIKNYNELTQKQQVDKTIAGASAASGAITTVMLSGYAIPLIMSHCGRKMIAGAAISVASELLGDIVATNYPKVVKLLKTHICDWGIEVESNESNEMMRPSLK